MPMPSKPPMPPIQVPTLAGRRRVAVALLGVPTALAVVAMSGCDGRSLLAPSSIVVTEAEIAERAQRLFPLQRRLLGLLDVQLEVPRIALRPERNRIAVAMRARASVALVGRSPGGEIAFETGLRFEPSDQSLRFVDVRVERFDFDMGTVGQVARAALGERDTGASAPSAGPGFGTRVGRVVAEEMLEGATIWRPDDAQRERLARAGVRPGAVTVRPGGIEIALDKVPPAGGATGR